MEAHTRIRVFFSSFQDSEVILFSSLSQISWLLVHQKRLDLWMRVGTFVVHKLYAVVSFFLLSSGLQLQTLGTLRMDRQQTFRDNVATFSTKVEHFDMIATLNSPIEFEYEFTVFGEPVPLQRHRIARGIAFNPSKKVN